MPWLWSLCAAPDASQRESALRTAYELLDLIAVIPTSSSSHQIPQLLDLLSKTLADAESLNVRIWSVRSLGKLSEFIEQGEDAEIVSRPQQYASRCLLNGLGLPPDRLPISCTWHGQRAVSNT